MRRLLALLAVVAAAAAIAACGSGEPDQACIITAAGAELCGGDAAAYCERFVRRSLDRDSVTGCAAVGVDVLPPAAPAADRDALVSKCARAGGEQRDCEAMADSAHGLVAADLGDDILACIRAGGVPRFCLSDTR